MVAAVKIPPNQPLGQGYIPQKEQEALSRLDASLNPSKQHKPTFAELLQQPGDSTLKQMFWGAFKFHFFLKVVVKYQVWLRAMHDEAMKLAQAEARRDKRDPVRGYEEDLYAHTHMPNWLALADDTFFDQLMKDLEKLYDDLEKAYIDYMEALEELIEHYAKEGQALIHEAFDSAADHSDKIHDLLAFRVHPDDLEESVDVFNKAHYKTMLENLRSALRIDYIQSPLSNDFVREQALPALSAALCLCGVKSDQTHVKEQPLAEWVHEKFIGLWKDQATDVEAMAEKQLAKVSAIEKRIEATLSQAVTKLGAVNAFKAHETIMQSRAEPSLKPDGPVFHKKPER